MSMPTKRAQVLLENSTRDFQNGALFERRYVFCLTITGNFEYFQYFNFFQYLTKNWDNVFLVTSTKIENAAFLYKTVLSEANVKTNRMRNTKRNYHKEQRFASNYFICLKIQFQFKNIFQRVDLMHQLAKCPNALFVNAGVLFDCALFPSGILKYFIYRILFHFFFTTTSHSPLIIKGIFLARNYPFSVGALLTQKYQKVSSFKNCYLNLLQLFFLKHQIQMPDLNFSLSIFF